VLHGVAVIVHQEMQRRLLGTRALERGESAGACPGGKAPHWRARSVGAT
jgi:hypothetical protein